MHPDAISYASIAFSALAGACFWRGSAHPVLLLVAPVLCYVRLWLNMLDGMVALASGKASLRGEVVNDLPDRISDVLIFVGVAHSGLCAIDSGYAAAIFALLTTYVGLFGQALGVQRQFGGIMSKPWRMVALHIGTWATFGLLWSGHGPRVWQSLTLLDCTCLIIMAGCAQTIFVRLRRIMTALREKSAPRGQSCRAAGEIESRE